MTTKASIRGNTKSVGAGLTPLAEESPDRDILETLKSEHEEVKTLLTRLSDAQPAKERRELVQKIKAALIPHTKAEEKVVYDAVIATSEEDAEVDGREGYLEHAWAAKTLQLLEAAEATSAEHKAAAKVLKDLVQHHIEEEEENVWRDVREHFDRADRARMNAEFEAAKKKIKVS